MSTFRPGERLRDRVVSIEVIGGGGEATVLPSSGAVLGLQLTGRVRTDDGALTPIGVTGIQSTARRYTYDPNTVSMLVRFTPQGLSSLGVPASELTNRSVGLDELVAPARVREVRERILEARDDAARVSVVASLLASLPYVADPQVEEALVRLARGDDDAAVSRVARAVGWSERQLERRLLARVGVTPQRFASLRRFERALELMHRRPSLTDVAVEAGYYDQPHFIREVRRFTGTSPRALAARR